MHLLTKPRQQKKEDRQYMSIQKDRERQKPRELVEIPVRHYSKTQSPPLSLHQLSQVQGVNSQKDVYSIAQVGGLAHWWTLNLSTLPGQQRRLLTVQGASTYLVNIADQNFPSSINIVVNQVSGFLNHSGDASHVIATLAVDGAPSAVMNGGGIVGYNVSYKLLGDGNDSIDITGIPSLSFEVTLEGSATPVQYPLNHPISLKMQVLRAIL